MDGYIVAGWLAAVGIIGVYAISVLKREHDSKSRSVLIEELSDPKP